VSPRRAIITINRSFWRAPGVRTGSACVRDVHGRHCCPSDSISLCRHLGGCIEEIASWIRGCEPSSVKRRRDGIRIDHPTASSSSASIGSPLGRLSQSRCRDLGVYLDSDMSMRSHTTRLVSRASTDLQDSSIASTFNTDDTHLQFQHIQT